jgi:PAS domain S-box-containing protein
MALGSPDTRFLRVNRAFCEMLGYREEELVGRTSIELTHPDDVAATQEAAERLVAGKVEQIDLEKRFVRKDGKVVWAIVRSRCNRGRDGNPDLLIGHFLDITARKAAEREMKESAERFRLALEAAELGTWDLDVRSGGATVNARYLEMLGYAPGEIEPRYDGWARPMHPDAAPQAMAAFAAHLRGETDVFESEYRMRHKSGEWIWVLDRGRVIERDADGRALRACGTHLDITFRKVAERLLAQEHELLEQARRREVETGHAIQRALLIGDPPAAMRGIEIAGYTEASQGIDGDFYAFTTFRPDCLELLVGDVMGKGVPAALVGAAVRTAYNQVVTELVAASLSTGELPRPAAIMNALHARLTPRLI